ncbi:MAG: DUF4190 domain-containing protein [Candidatus Nealsonbacteria bacterium]|nr:DUF4190 domain-containing protein [Candidatus Nealsonbacteria bacterium]
MPIPFVCPHCGRRTDVPEEYAGQTGPCIECGRQVTVPAADGGWKCPRCGAPMTMAAAGCGQCGAVFRATHGEDLGENAAVRMLIPVGRSALAIAAGYAGLFAVLIFPAPIALILGILAVRDIRRHPKKHGMGRAVFGIVMGGIGSVFLLFGLVGLIAQSLGG